MKNQAFTLVELAVYTALVSIFSLLVFGCLHTVWQAASHHVRQSSLMVGQCVGLDVLRKDVLSASMSPEHWLSEPLVFKKETIDEKGKTYSSWVGWTVSKGQLKRYEGIFDAKQKKWIKKVTSLVASGFQSLQCQLACDPKSSHVKEVLVTYSILGDGQHQETFLLRNRVLT